MVGNGAIANLPTGQRRDSAPLPTLRNQDFRSALLVSYSGKWRPPQKEPGAARRGRERSPLSHQGVRPNKPLHGASRRGGLLHKGERPNGRLSFSAHQPPNVSPSPMTSPPPPRYA